MKIPAPAVRAIALALTFAFAPAFVEAQDPTNLRRGRGAPTAYASDQHDAVNLFNGNYSFVIPIGDAYPVSEALSYALTVQYNSNVWDFDWGPEDSVNALPELYGNAGLGWNLGLARMKQVGTSASNCTNWVLIEADGSRRQIFDRLHAGDTVTTACYTRDSSYLRIKKVGSTWEVESPSGLVRVFDASGEPKAIRDRFSNTVSVDTHPGETPTHWDLTDSSSPSRVISVQFETVQGLPERVKYVDLPKFGGGTRARWNFTYAPTTISRHWKHSSDDVKGGLPIDVQVQLLTSVAPPAGGSYDMTYYQTNESAPPYMSPSGALKSLKLPTKGKYEYKYRTFSFGTPPSSAPWTAQADALGLKSVIGANGTPLGDWAYWQGPRPDGTVPANPARERRTWVKTPEHGDVSVSYFTTEDGSWKNGLPFTDQVAGGGGRYLSRRMYEGDPSGAGAALVRTEWVRYNADYHAGYATGRENQRFESSRLVYNDDPGFYADTTLSGFDGLGHYRTTATGGNFDSGNATTTNVNFNATNQTYSWDANVGGSPPSYAKFPIGDAWVLDRFDFQQVSDSTGAFRTDYSFNATTGFLNSIRRRKVAASPGNADTLAFFCLDSASRFVDRETYYGGDNQSLSGVAPDCGEVGPNGATGPSGWAYRIDHGYSFGQRAWSQHRETNGTFAPHRDYHVDIDSSTGMVKSNYDVSGYKTNYEFDAIGRLLKVEPMGNGSSEKGAVTSYSWATGGGVVGLEATISTACPSGVSDCVAGGSFGQTVLSWDGFGRLTREKFQQPDGTSARRDTFWNALGWMTQTSVLGANSGSNRNWVFYDFDAFGRPRKIDLPDKADYLGGSHIVTLGYTGDREATRAMSIAIDVNGTEASFTTTQTFDRRGRLIKVVQPLSSGNLKTSYGYDAIGNLVSVEQGPQSGAPIQTRTRTIDGRGFLTQETHPEKGGAVVASSIDARGHALILSDSGSTGRLSYVYDKSERIKEVWEGSAPSRVLKEWTYGTSGAGLGKMSTAKRYNYFPAINNTAIVTETYTYGGVYRLPTARSTQLYVSNANQERYDQTFSWNRDGTLDRQTYPGCFQGGCGAGGVAGRLVDYNYKEGFLVEIPSFTTALAAGPPDPIEYHKNGMMTTLRHANSVTETIAVDPSGLPRRTNLTLTSPVLNASIGTYAYDGEGNLKTQGLNDFAYDGGSRLVKAFMGIGAHNKTQDFTMDLVGNVTQIKTNGSGPAIPTDSASNRLNGGGVFYDLRGNLVDWNGQHYEYDRLNKMTRSCATWNSIAASCSSQDWLHVYTADDERMWQYRMDAAGSLFTLRGLDRKVLRTYDSSQGANAFTDSIWANGRLFATITSGGMVAHWHTDELGTPIAQTNSSQGIQTTYAYFPYGEEINQSLVDPARFRFTGHERDLGTQPGTADDRDYMHQRATLPQLGRFLSVDPIGGNPFNPQSWNRFTYALNNPMKYIDPLGLLADVITVTGTLPPEVGPTNGENEHNPPTTADGDGSGGDADGTADTKDESDSPCAVPPGVSADDNARAVRAALAASVLLAGPVTGPIGVWGTLTAMVAPTSVWDFKYQYGNVEYQNFGNHHFGRVFDAAFVPEAIALRGAGLAQYISDSFSPVRHGQGVPWGASPHGDDARDQVRIKQAYAGEPCH